LAKIILDACAVIAFFRGETGDDIVANYLFDDGFQCLIHSVNLCEIYYDFLRSSGQAEAENMLTDLESVGVQFNSDLSVDFWKQVSRYKANIRRISLADCFALTLANREGGILVTSDRKEFEPVVPLNICQINFIR
jgi:PIN domain nuclease of toxin-antitoxin system